MEIRGGDVAIISVRDVWKVYGKDGAKTYALKGVSLDIERGDFIAIIGPSGSGKSTLMHILGILDAPSRGEVIVKGRDVSRISDDERAILRRNTIGFVFQQYNLSPSLTAVENVELPMIFAGAPQEDRRKRARELLELVGLGNRLHHYPNQLSGGQQQRVAVARALANDPEVILGDEPTGNLDTKTGEKILDLLENLNKMGKTVVIVTHDPEIAKKVKKIVKIRDGKVEGSGK